MELQTIWSWQPALYLFLGGMGAGAFVMAAVLFLIDRTRHRLIVCVSMWAALASLRWVCCCCFPSSSRRCEA